ncbi:PREDICTED: C-C motif chemokine 3-like [Pseudopodoces humilis]|uniref:C-C motif chemokine 3-like n=1 Tax=Pseudopodoces humilis TaxID=181119 RepID=UPI000395DB32|nr:PREDICTED: C-C motif chemokine 3-like [Pseudopodoces humilis]
MRVLVAALAVLLLVAICSLAEADLGVSRNAALFQKDKSKPISCCFAHITRPIPPRIIRSAYRTSSSCQMQAVVLVTRDGREVCADPMAHWVQKYLKHLELLKH